MDNKIELTEAEVEAVEALQRALNEQLLPKLHTLRISLEVIAAQLRYAAEESELVAPRLVH
jgi:hypothetical protein